MTLAVIGLAWDLRKPAHLRYRKIEYAFAALCGFFGAMIAICVDMVTIGLSAEYFQLGKKLGSGASWKREALFAGWQAGFVFGLLAAVLILVFNSQRVSLQRLLRASLRLPVFGLAGAGVFAAIASIGWYPPSHYFIGSEVVDRFAFMQVWMIHLGAYVGSIVGALLVVRSIRKSG